MYHLPGRQWLFPHQKTGAFSFLHLKTAHRYHDVLAIPTSQNNPSLRPPNMHSTSTNIKLVISLTHPAATIALYPPGSTCRLQRAPSDWLNSTPPTITFAGKSSFLWAYTLLYLHVPHTSCIYVTALSWQTEMIYSENIFNPRNNSSLIELLKSIGSLMKH